jgi:hypothetical protein
MHWNVSIGPEKWPIFGRFLSLFPLKRPAPPDKNTSNMAATIGDVMDDVTCKCSIELLKLQALILHNHKINVHTTVLTKEIGSLINFFLLLDYLLSNNHINSIIVHKFDFSDEEVSFKNLLPDTLFILRLELGKSPVTRAPSEELCFSKMWFWTKMRLVNPRNVAVLHRIEGQLMCLP